MTTNMYLILLYCAVGISSLASVVSFMHLLHQRSSSSELGNELFQGTNRIITSDILGSIEDIATTEATVIEDDTQSDKLTHDKARSRRRYNVMFIMSDDMRAQLGCYQDVNKPLSHPHMRTPHLDQLASRSLLLKNAHVQYTLCGPSRTSILTGRRPDDTRIFDNRQYWRHIGGNFTTIPQYFKEHGYRTVGIGKIFHREEASGDNDPMSWTDPYIMPPHTEGRYLQGEAGWRSVTRQQTSELPLMDTQAVDETEQFLINIADTARSGEQPFFVALGFKKPHSSYVCPEEFYNMYPLESAEQFLADLSWQTVTLGNKERKLQNITFTGEGKAQIPTETLRHLRRGYFACISFIDHLVGRVVKILNKLDLTESTIVSFVADHGYHFGENGDFGKQSLHETSTHVPMMLHIPGRTNSGIASNSVVEAIDLFPSLVKAAGLPPLPECPNNAHHQNELHCTQGRSLLPLIDNPKLKIKDGALSQISATLGYMRYSLRTENFRYSEWARIQRDDTPEGIYKVMEMDPLGTWTELYDHRYDPEEVHNVTSHVKYSNLREKLSDKLSRMVLTS